MVSNRCKLAVKEELKKLGLHFMVVDLGEVEIMESISVDQREQLKMALLTSGLELIDDKRAVLIEKAGGKRLTLSFYIYHEIKNCQLFRDHLFLKWNAIDVLGRIYIASEGINAQLSVPSKYFNNFKKSIDQIDFLKNIT